MSPLPDNDDTDKSKRRIRIGHYQILNTIGSGSFGKVKLATHTVTGHKVAMKIINRGKIADLDMGGRVKREIQYLKLLRHPHIIKLYEVLTTPTEIYLVIEYAGGELFNYIVDRGRMPENEARRFFQQIISAVDYCHRHKIVHRDLKPENLLLDEYLNVKIADFGLSNIMTDGDFLKTSCGSPNYAAPEVISGKLYAGPEIDIWSCGVILYVMLCGRLPFDDEYIPALFRKINGGIYTLPNYLSPGARHLLARMLVVDPVDRITIAGIRETDWFNTNLPDYLRPLATDADDVISKPAVNIDEAIVDELWQKMHFTKDMIRRALTEQGTEDGNHIRVAYQLVVDHKRLIKDSHMADEKNLQGFLATSPPPWNGDDFGANGIARNTSIRHKKPPVKKSTSAIASSDDDDDSPLARSNISILTASLPPNSPHRHTNASQTLRLKPTRAAVTSPLAQQPLSSLSTLSSAKTHTVQERGASSPSRRPRKSGAARWHFGIRSRSPPIEIMLEIYRALKNLGMEWKTITVDKSDDDLNDEKDQSPKIDPYHVRARCPMTELGVVVKIDLRLYVTGEEANGSYLVDFKSVGYDKIGAEPSNGDVDVTSPFLFFTVATNLIREFLAE